MMNKRYETNKLYASLVCIFYSLNRCGVIKNPAINGAVKQT